MLSPINFAPRARCHPWPIEMATRIAANPPLVVQGVKQVLNARSERVAEESLRTVALWNAAFLPSQDLGEAMASFVQRRPPSFKGR